ncbi:MAG: antitoxin [Deltaproteobacteria bacterium]|nr:antitoxin [Deltaproteobacteria bacterium]
MRTTLTLDPDVARLLEEAMRREHRSLKAVVNDALRLGLSPRPKAKTRVKFRVRVHETELLAGFDRNGFNRIADELEDDAVLRRGHVV